MWPKDRTIFHRLEKVCHCVEKGEWPTMNRFAPRILDASDSRSNTPNPGAARSDYFVGVSDSMVRQKSLCLGSTASRLSENGPDRSAPIFVASLAKLHILVDFEVFSMSVWRKLQL